MRIPETTSKPNFQKIEGAETKPKDPTNALQGHAGDDANLKGIEGADSNLSSSGANSAHSSGFENITQNINENGPQEPRLITKFIKINERRTGDIHLAGTPSTTPQSEFQTPTISKKQLAMMSMPIAKRTDQVAESMGNHQAAEGLIHQEMAALKFAQSGKITETAKIIEPAQITKPAKQNIPQKQNPVEQNLSHKDLLTAASSLNQAEPFLNPNPLTHPTSQNLINPQVHPSQASLASQDSLASQGTLDALSLKVASRIVPSNQMHSFHIASAANERTESGGKAQFSKLRTTAGPNARASYGIAQLTIREHLTQLVKLNNDELQTLGTNKTQIHSMIEHGQAAESWYRIMQGRKVDFFARRLGLSPSHAKTLRAWVKNGDLQKIERHFGKFFTESTGLPASMAHAMAQGMVLHNGQYQTAFKKLYEAQFGEAFDKAHRVPRKMAIAALQMAEIHPEIGQALKLLGAPHLAASSLGHYLGVGDASENAHGWYALAAESVLGKDKYIQVIKQADLISSRMRQAYNVSRSISVVALASDLTGTERLKTIARLSRCFHGAPSRAKAFFFHNGALSSPKFHSKEALLRGLDEFIASRKRVWSDQRLVRSFEHVIQQEGLV